MNLPAPPGTVPPKGREKNCTDFLAYFVFFEHFLPIALGVFCAFAQHRTVLANTAYKFIFVGTFDEYIAELPFFSRPLDMNNIVNFR